MSNVKNITLNGERLGDMSKNELIRKLVEVGTLSNKFEFNLKMYAIANSKLKKQNEFFKKRLRSQ